MRGRNRIFCGTHNPLRENVPGGETRLDERGQQRRSVRQHVIVEVIRGIVELGIRRIATLVPTKRTLRAPSRA
jgi:hypothetical protein